RTRRTSPRTASPHATPARCSRSRASSHLARRAAATMPSPSASSAGVSTTSTRPRCGPRLPRCSPLSTSPDAPRWRAQPAMGLWGADGTAPYPSWRAALLAVATDQPVTRTHGWRARLAASSVGLGPFEEAYGHLQALADRVPEVRHLIHSDLLHYNVLVEADR